MWFGELCKFQSIRFCSHFVSLSLVTVHVVDRLMLSHLVVCDYFWLLCPSVIRFSMHHAFMSDDQANSPVPTRFLPGYQQLSLEDCVYFPCLAQVELDQSRDL